MRERWLRHYVTQKLRSDPVFPTAFALLAQTRKPILDVGCGIGLLGFYLRERGCDLAVQGVDRDLRKIARAREIVRAAGYRDLEFRDGDVRPGTMEFSGHVMLFDVLHYLSPQEQQELLLRLTSRVAAGGMLIIRDAPRDRRPRFYLTVLAERFAQSISWNVGGQLHFPSREELAAPFGEEFSGETRPLWGRTPFNNHLFIFRRRLSAVAPAAG